MRIDNADNKHLEAKLGLRRHFLKELVKSKTPIHVLDCCAGDGVIWAKLRQEFPVATYFGMDEKRKPARVKVDSARVLSMSGWTQNVVDIDTYGSPWLHFEQLLATCRHPVTVFLTWGSSGISGNARLCDAGSRFIGINGLQLPKGLRICLTDKVVDHAMAAAERNGFDVGEVIEAFPQHSARYLGVKMMRSRRTQ